MTVAQLEVGVRVGVGQVRDDKACVVQSRLMRAKICPVRDSRSSAGRRILLQDRLDDLGEKKVRPLAR